MSGWWGFVLTVGIGFAFGLIQGVHDWINDGWEERANKEAAEIGLPPATHKATKWGRIVSVRCIDPETGEWLWQSHR